MQGKGNNISEMDIKVEERQTLDFDLMQQVNRAENVAALYQAHRSSGGLGLELQRIEQEPILAIPPWSEAGIRNRISKWQPEIDNGGCLVTAVQDTKTVGFGLIGPKQADGSVELVALFVSSGARRLGVGTILFERLEQKAKEQDARSLLIYSNPTASAVDFYLRQKCKIIGLADKQLVPHLPWDIVFAKSVQ